MISGETDGDGSAQTRIRMIEKAYEIFKEHPILGMGLNTFAQSAGFGAYAHNNYMELLANLGLSGCLIYYIPLLIYFKRAYVNWRREYAQSVLPLAIIGIYLINDIGLVSYFAMTVHPFLALGLGLCINISSQQNKEEIKNPD